MTLQLTDYLFFYSVIMLAALFMRLLFKRVEKQMEKGLVVIR